MMHDLTVQLRDGRFLLLEDGFIDYEWMDGFVFFNGENKSLWVAQDAIEHIWLVEEE